MEEGFEVGEVGLAGPGLSSIFCFDLLVGWIVVGAVGGVSRDGFAVSEEELVDRARSIGILDSWTLEACCLTYLLLSPAVTLQE